MQSAIGFLKDYNGKKRFGWNALTQEQIDYVRATYKQCGSIKKTVALTKYCEATVQKYCCCLSSLDKHSRYAERSIAKICPQTGKILVIYKNANVASKISGISASCICKALKGVTETAGGYAWVLAKDYKKGGYHNGK